VRCGSERGGSGVELVCGLVGIGLRNRRETGNEFRCRIWWMSSEAT
jgi:hypothetical protein